MEKEHHPFHILVGALAIGAFILFGIGNHQSPQNIVQATGTAGATENVTGFAWSDTTGWLSFNCSNPSDGIECSQINYGVHIDPTDGHFAGTAWSSSIGWISFNRAMTGNPPSPQDAPGTIDPGNGTGPIAQLDSGGVARGWARALSACLAVPCTDAGPSIRSGKWDGWISLSETTRINGEKKNVHISGNKLVGFAWSGYDPATKFDSTGWINFNCSDCIAAPTDTTTTVTVTDPITGTATTTTTTIVTNPETETETITTTTTVTVTVTDPVTGTPTTTTTTTVTVTVTAPKTGTVTVTDPITGTVTVTDPVTGTVTVTDPITGTVTVTGTETTTTTTTVTVTVTDPVTGTVTVVDETVSETVVVNDVEITRRSGRHRVFIDPTVSFLASIAAVGSITETNDGLADADGDSIPDRHEGICRFSPGTGNPLTDILWQVDTDTLGGGNGAYIYEWELGGVVAPPASGPSASVVTRHQPGTWTGRVTVVSGPLRETIQCQNPTGGITLQINPLSGQPQDFTISATPSHLTRLINTVPQTGTFTLSVLNASGLGDSPVVITPILSSALNGKATISPSSATIPAPYTQTRTFTVTITSSDDALRGTHPITFTGNSGSKTDQTAVQLIIQKSTFQEF